MKRGNQWALPLILCVCATLVFYIVGVLILVKYSLSTIAAPCFGCAIGFGFATGCFFIKAKAIHDLNRDMELLEKLSGVLGRFDDILDEAKSEEPFGEFVNTTELPFPEVRGENNGKHK